MLAAREVRRYVYLRTGRKLAISELNRLPESGDVVIVARQDHRIVSELEDELGHAAGPGGYFLRSVTDGGRTLLVIAGHDAASTLHGAYRFAEHLGVGFGLAGDAIPDRRIELQLDGFDEASEPRFSTRGILPYHDFFAGPDLWNTDDYLLVVSQLPKLGMNFIGFHSYNTRYGSQWAMEEDYRTGPEPTVWIGLPGDVKDDGTVSWSYPATYAHTHRERTWGFTTGDTDDFHAGAGDLFAICGYGSELVGPEVPATVSGSNAVFDRVGAMQREVFTLARRLGVETAVGTELPLGLEPAGTGDIDPPEDWVRGMPLPLQQRIRDLGLDPSDPDVVREVYRGIFTRIMNTHPLDYYWLWSYEIWSLEGVTPEQIASIEADILLAREALAELGDPFRLAHAGWITGTVDDPAELEDVFPPESPFYSGWGDALGHDRLGPERIGWPGIHMEQDWGLVQPQGGVFGAYDDISASFEYGTRGSIGNIWRTRVLDPNVTGVRSLHWARGPTGSELDRDLPTDVWEWVEGVYLDWATRRFGPEHAETIARIMSDLDGDFPAPTGWVDDGPGEILTNPEPWSTVRSDYDFVTELESVRDELEGVGNRARFDYWLKTFQSLRLMAEYGCVRYEFEQAMDEEHFEEALEHRIRLARLFEDIITLAVEKVTNASDLGEIIHLELVNWQALMVERWDDELTFGLGEPLPAEAHPSRSYAGEPFVTVSPARTHVSAGESLELRVLIAGEVSDATLYYRTLGEGGFRDLQLEPVARSVFRAVLPPMRDDFEYCIVATGHLGEARFPATAPDLNHTVVVLPEVE